MTEKVTTSANATQSLVEIEEIKNGVVLLKNGGLRAVIMVGGINFELKSEQEQDIITAGYQDFLNALDFSLQMVIHSRKLNIDRYLSLMEATREKEENPLLQNQIDEYVQFIRGFVKENEIMTKNFFVVVPYDSFNIKDAKRGISRFLPFGSKKQSKTEKKESLEQKTVQLRQRIDQVVGGLERVGLRAVSLNDEELTELYYNVYNPQTTTKKLPHQSV